MRLKDDVIFGNKWERKELSPRERRLITVSSLLTGGNTEQLRFHLNKAYRRRIDRSYYTPCPICRMAKSHVSRNGCQTIVFKRKII
ncbi:MAG: carboxymuconolactone decarboxylase family protein [Neobacillus sp.]